MHILILGSGGRESALAWKFKQSSLCKSVFIAPGNGGSSQYGTNLDIAVDDFDAIEKAVQQYAIDMLIVGPELPLVLGITDYFKKRMPKLWVFGPDQESAQLEGSKAYAKTFMNQLNIPTAKHKRITKENLDEGIQLIQSSKGPFVLKADGLAAGKGVLILNDAEIACTELQNMIGGKFGDAGQTVVIEEFLDGNEFSVFAITDGKSYKLLPVAKDYKRIGEADTGLNTGGMGAVSPVSFLDETLMRKVEDRIVAPTVNGLAAKNMNYNGVLFFGLINVNGDPYVIEYNCRFGDPETEVILPRLESDLVAHLKALFEGTLKHEMIRLSNESVCTVMLVSGGYPGKYTKGIKIEGLEKVEDAIVFHAGTKNVDGSIHTNGGRVLAITASGSNLQEALDDSYKSAALIDFDGKYCRPDIGFDQ